MKGVGTSTSFCVSGSNSQTRWHCEQRWRREDGKKDSVNQEFSNREVIGS